MTNIIEKIESKILTKLFKRWLTREYDLELLGMTRTMISNREYELKKFVDTINRVEIKGYRRDSYE